MAMLMGPGVGDVRCIHGGGVGCVVRAGTCGRRVRDREVAGGAAMEHAACGLPWCGWRAAAGRRYGTDHVAW